MISAPIRVLGQHSYLSPFKLMPAKGQASIQ
jgi:hypothetical protein